MAYFDSPKNRAIWERELRGLRAEKERRAREGYTPNEARSKAAQVKKEENPFRRRTSLKELERQEQEAREARRAARPVPPVVLRRRAPSATSPSNRLPVLKSLSAARRATISHYKSYENPP